MITYLVARSLNFLAYSPSFMLGDFTTSFLANMANSVGKDGANFANTLAC